MQETTMRIVNKESVAQFQNKLQNGKWENICQLNEVNVTFNLFSNTCLLAFFNTKDNK
jgi:hypothetical protein